ncbi:MAG: P1 family peptidase [Patescibacteria group bacterium]|nr:P1 family peptidase [Patescibacteria group bacterium]
MMDNKKTISKKRFRSFGFATGVLPPGAKNTIADVPGVRVGHLAKIRGRDIRTGITIIDPGVAGMYEKKIPAAIAVGNGVGKLAGFTQVEELGTLEAPVALTNTLAVGPVMRGVVDLVVKISPKLSPLDTINAVVGETNDGFLNDIHRDVITKADVQRAWAARSANVRMGSVGAGTGTKAFAWKGGIGSASRMVTLRGKRYTLGALVQTNYRGLLTVLGVPVWEKIGGARPFRGSHLRDNGSCMIVYATDAPLTARQLKRIAARAFVGLARTGSVLSHGSGDYAIAFTTSRAGLEGSGSIGKCLPDEMLDVFFQAAAETAEESVYDALFLAETMRGREGNILEAIPVNAVVEIIRRYLRCE